jgi:hypothetical protein
MSSNDFLEFDDDAQGQDSSSGRSPFVLLAGILILVLILASVGTVYLLSQRNQGSGEQAAAIEATNAVIAVTNTAVAETVAAMATEQAQPPTETPTPSPAVTAVSTETPTVDVTDTPVVIAGVTVDSGTPITSVITVTVEGGTVITSVATIETGAGTITPTAFVVGEAAFCAARPPCAPLKPLFWPMDISVVIADR